jgi:serine/threonine protein kinase
MADDGWNHIDFEDIEVGDKVGGGGVGMIYRGWFKNEPVALKSLFESRMDEETKKEFMDELLVMSKLNHSNIVQLKGACLTPPNLCYVMELCSSSLYNMLHVERENFNEHFLVSMATDVASAMEYLHAQQPVIIHRDIKSHNVLHSSSGAFKLCDFGLVTSRVTQAGTPAYMAPELFEGKSFNKSVDVYSFGILLCEAFSQHVPWYMIGVMDIKDKVLEGERPKLPSFGCPSRVAELIKRCWSGGQADRPDFTTIVDELLEVGQTTNESKYTDVLQASEGKDALDDLIGFK